MFRRSNPFTLSGFTLLACLIIPTTAIPVAAVVTERLKLISDDSTPGDDFGFSVAVSQGVAVVGARNSGVGGAAYLFDSTTGQQLFKLAPDDLIAGADFGRWIAVDGDLVVIGARDQDLTGAAYVFDLTTGDQVAKLSIPSSTTSVAIHENFVLIGAISQNVGGVDFAGAVNMFDLASGSLVRTFVADVPMTSDNLGSSVAFDGGLVAAYDSDNPSSVLLFDPLTGNQLADIPAPDTTLAGSSVAIRGDRLLIGAPSVFPKATAGIYDIADTDNVSKLLIPWPGQSKGFFFGSSVALNDDVALISTWFSEDIAASGIVHLFDPDTGVLLESFRSSDGVEDDRFGSSIGLFGQTLIVGASGSVVPTIPGAAYLFTIPEPVGVVVFAVLGPVLFGRSGRSPGQAGG